MHPKALRGFTEFLSFNGFARSGKQIMRQFKSFDQRIHVRFGIIHAKGRPTGCRDPQMIHKRPGAMVPCPHRDAPLVEDRGNVMRMGRAVQREGKDRRLVRALALHGQPVHYYL